MSARLRSITLCVDVGGGVKLDGVVCGVKAVSSADKGVQVWCT